MDPKDYELEDELVGSYDEEDEDVIEHYGMPRRSGRYPWGSGENPYQHCDEFLDRVRYYRRNGLSDEDIAKAMQMTVVSLKTQEVMAKAYSSENKDLTETEVAKKLGISTGVLRANEAIVAADRRAIAKARVMSLASDGLNNSEIARKMGFENESSVRALLNEDVARNKAKAMQTADFLKSMVDERGMIEVGKGWDRHMGISEERLNQALLILELQGYPHYGARVPQGGKNGHMTTIRVLCPPGSTQKDAYRFEDIHTIDYHTEDNGDTFVPDYVYPRAMDPKRLKIRWGGGEGGELKDGVIEVRRGVKDLDLGDGVNYAQVRILVDYGGGKHDSTNKDRYLKGMAVYGDDKDFPPGVDVIFNTHHTIDDTEIKGDEKNALKPAAKNLKGGSDNPFGAAIKTGLADPDDPGRFDKPGQHYYIDEKGHKQLSLINKRAEEGDWDEWRKTIPSQFLAKQNQALIDQQLDISVKEHVDDLDSIMQLTNPVIKKKLLLKYADQADADAVHLRAASLPGQRYQVIMPLTTIKDNEVYAPNFEDGTMLYLVRFPHGGTFEIPALRVNNRNAEGKRVFGANTKDMVGISAKAAAQLSGADFDGDTVMCIPANPKFTIDAKPILPGLGEDFDHLTQYAEYPGMKVMDKSYQQFQMGLVSNLIMDMTLGGASDEELAAAVRHSMVVIDANKHHLDYRQSAEDNNISALHKKYQKHTDLEGNEKEKGAATLITRAKSTYDIPKRQGSGTIDPETGKVSYKTAKQVYIKEEGLWKNTIQKEDGIYYFDKEGKSKRASDDAPVRNAEAWSVYAPYVDKNGKTKNAWLSAYEKNGELYYNVGKGKDRQTLKVTEDMKVRSTPVTQKVAQMEYVDDAMQLSSGLAQEEAYGRFANSLKDLANKARKEAMAIETYKANPSAKALYSEEIASLDRKLMIAEMNDPLERKAEIATAGKMKYIRQVGDYKDAKDLQKQEANILKEMRNKFGAKSHLIELTPREWEAIQAGAISATKLNDIAKKMDDAVLRQLATPRGEKKTLSTTTVQRIKAYANSGRTNQEIANALGISVSTVLKYLD